uniref:TTC5_OB domain-containing protein n=1 Tax=Anisakis simplex TaxID=6269 RepID=A0A0M3J9A5_ANISI
LTVKDDRESLSPDLHLNYATALKFEQDFAKCLQHLFIASKLDPHFFDAKERYESLCIYLKHFSEAIQRKGRLKSKRLVEFQKALSNIPSNKSTQQQQLLSRRVYRNNAARDSDDRKEEKELTECDFESLHEGPNENVYIVGKVCGIVPNPDSVPFI